jgi:hypothetical protein
MLVSAVDSTAATLTLSNTPRSGGAAAVPAASSADLDTALDALESVAGLSAAQSDAIADAIRALIRAPHGVVDLDWFIRQPPANIASPTVI